ncbi:extracellular solute-binding protein, family 1 precursor [Lactobacillus selangorensis]|uniref:Extracellular solute-binding protein, family 1 n=2 Tax=Lactobacillus selangorensis TaxID=81857 RepID=A0A0R2FN37_9LACO|nr:extracellular solute-binding protein, family 1 precursor [Lactobacillus selangorensis]KRN29937.1 extracellular solute-binding protein, family 1 precursor [Lactobacillus selangorensis]
MMGLAAVSAVAAMFIFALRPQPVQHHSSRTTITFWHSMNGPNEKVLLALIRRFNRSQTKYTVKPIYAGSYELSVMKYANTVGSNVAPDVIQSDQANQALMLDLKATVPVQKFVDRDHYDLSQLYPGVTAAYRIKGSLASMPFNSSSSVLYYNQDLFKKYAVPNLPLAPTYSDVTKAAVALTKRSHGAVKGMTLQIYGWLPEELAANQNAVIVNHGNGRRSLATAATLDSPAMQASMLWLQNVIKQGAFQNLGTGSAAANNQNAAFLAQKVGLFMQSSALLSQMQKSAKFKYGVVFTPHPDGTQANGVAIGGASLWITKNKPAAVQEGAWQLLKFLMTPQAQAAWQLGTGYFTVNQRASHEKTLAAAIRKQPALAVPIAQLKQGHLNAATAGAYFGNIQEERRNIEIAMQQIYGGADVQTALRTAETNTNAAIQKTNQVNRNQQQ